MMSETTYVTRYATGYATRDNTRVSLRQSQSQSQSQSPFLCLSVVFWPKSVATEVQTARANVAGASRDELNSDNPQHPSEPAAAPTSEWHDARKGGR